MASSQLPELLGLAGHFPLDDNARATGHWPLATVNVHQFLLHARYNREKRSRKANSRSISNIPKSSATA